MENNKKTNILYIPSDTQGGVFYYRTLTPMVQLKQMFPEKYEVFITNDIQQAWQSLKQIQILIVHNCLYDDKMQIKVWNLVTEAKKIGIKTILDMDDYWNYGEEHPLFKICMANAFPVKAPVNFNIFDCVTTTTERLKKEILPYNKNVYILENCISKNDGQYSMKKNPSKRIRLGLTGGSSHTNDIKQLIGEDESFLDYLSDCIRNKIQLVLCGFNVEGKKLVLNEHGNVSEQRKLDPNEVWWVQLEKQITKDYSIVSDEYRQLLLKYDGSDEQFDSSNEPYRRVWTKSIKDMEYGHIYENIDILLVPLTDTKFNNQKSALKFVEAGFTNTAVISSNVPPYSDYGVDYRDCIFVDKPTPKCWAEVIEGIVNRPDKLKLITRNLREKALDLNEAEKITKKRGALYEKIMNS